ncbi:MAG: 4Fe-4S binding protein, partial [bacterium]
MPESRKHRLPVYWWRRLSQLLFLGLFLFLFRMTDYQGSDEIPYAVNIFFRWDPLIAASAMLAARTFISLLVPSLVVIVLTLFLGRFFCGWVCPLGTLLDASATVIKPVKTGPAGKLRPGKYYLLALIIVCALFGLPLVGYFDPFSILVRGLTLAVDPALNVSVAYPFDYVYQSEAVGFLTPVSEPVYDFLKDNLLPYNQKFFALALPSLVILLAVFGLEKIERRFWCRNLCPLGGMLALVSRYAPLRQHPGGSCSVPDCSTCRDICRMGAINHEGAISPGDCNLCLDCVALCHKKIISFKFKKTKRKPAATGVSRRGFAWTLVAGLALPAFYKVRALHKKPDPLLIRPPGSLPEDEFKDRCVRCGECMKVCINNAIQPAFLQAGSEGTFSPVIVPRIGYCEYNCTLCGQVCPTGAIRELPLKEKQEVKIGRAYF